MKHSPMTVTRYRIFLYVFYLFLTTFKIDIIWNNKSEIALLCLYVDFSNFFFNYRVLSCIKKNFKA